MKKKYATRRHLTRQQLYARSRLMYIFEAALEYLISLIVGGAFLATLTGYMGMSDSLTGIISAFITMGRVFQLFSMFIRRRRMKPFVIFASVANQILFMLLYVVPLSGMAKPVKATVFVIIIFLAYFIYNVVFPKKITFFMALVDDRHRGSFTSTKEIVSLISGILFQFAMGSLMDHFRERGDIETAFAISAVVILVISALHTLTCCLTVEKPTPHSDKKLFDTIREVFTNKPIIRLTVLLSLYTIAGAVSTAFYGTYLINELGFSLKLTSLLSIGSSLFFMASSRPWGKYADRKSFALMIEKCFFFLAAGYLCFTFASPTTRIVTVFLYYALVGISNGGVGSAMMNMVFDYAPPDKQADSLAVSQAFSGIIGFLSTLAISPLVDHIQKSGNTFFGLPLYAQQVTSFISFLLVVLCIVYVRAAFLKEKKDT